MGVITAIVQTPTNLVRFWKNVIEIVAFGHAKITIRDISFCSLTS
ncbi:hypothetical protein Bhyg_04439 [Pseudolycoriella hygida]|uniref:Uncharacterized protein n=1 Tax=Pseudolycoriella hygida TaxID=35572 RepID=A0A9Q0SA24_9DIPT|nr:hypothetical protein Bhyg_04439 [Pseudolycoriella hygida]